MSWKGLVKAAKRLPHQIRAKSGHAESTIDYEYDDMESAFKTLELAAKKLNDDAKKFKDALEALLKHQMEFGSILGDVYAPVVNGRGRGERTASGEDGVGDHGLPRAITPPQSLKAVQDFTRAMAAVNEELSPELDSITRRVVQPTSDYITLIEAVKKMTVKRAHKLIDYDRNRLAVKSLKDKPEKTFNDEKELTKKQMMLDQATREYENINNLMKQQLPVFLDLRVQFIDPCFMTLYWYQLKVYTVITQHLHGLMNENYDSRITATELGQAAHQRCIDILSQVSLIRTIASKDPPAYNYPDESGNDSGNENAGRSSSDYNNPPPYADSNNNIYPSPTSISTATSSPAFSIAKPSSTFPSKPAYNTTYNQPKTYGSPTRDYTSPSKSAYTPPSVAPPRPPPQLRQQQNVQYVVALYDFDGQQDGDLVFRKGDRIEVVERTDNVQDWWSGRLRRVQGQFPGNYVQDA